MEKKFKLFKIQTVNRQSTDGQSLRQYSVSTRLFRLAALFTLLFTIAVGQMWATSRTFKSGEKIYFKDASGNITWGDLKCLWVVSTGNVYAHFWNDTESATSSWGNAVSGSKNNANTIYEITVPGSGKEFTHVIFTRGDESNKFWNQTTDQYPDESYNMFCISNDGYYSTSQSPNHQWYGTWDRFSTGSLCGDFNNWDPDKGKFTDGRVILELEASTAYGFKVLKGDGTVLDNWYGLNSGNITNTTSSWWTLKSKENNCTVTSGEAGEYCFHWDGSSTLGVYYPQTRFSASQYIYFNVEGETGWKDLGNKVMFWTKYYDSGGNNPDGGLSCNTPVETYVYYAQIPNHDYIGQVQLNRYDGSTYKASSAVAYAYNRSSSSQNCMIEESGNESATDNWTPQWTTYCPPTTSETFTDNSTTKISWQPNTNDGSTSGKAIWVKTGTTLKVTANASKAVADPNMTIKYDFDVNSGSTTTQTTGAYTATASTNNTQYAVNAKMYTNYNLDNTASSTKHTHTIYYKALDTYSVTHTLSGVTKASGRAGDDAAAYHVAYDATYTANAGYYLPSDITVTIGGATKTKGTDYTWTVTDATTGALTILTDKIDGNVVVTINGIWRWSVAGSWLNYPATENWDADTYAMGNITKDGDDDVCSVEVTLSANTNYTFKIADRAANPYEYWGNNTSTFYMTYGNSSNWTFGNDASNTAACGLTTAGAGTYTFTYNIPRHKVSVTYPESFQVTAAGNPAAGGTVTPSSATYMSTTVGGEITATPNYAHYFNGWTSSAGGTFTNASAATTTFKPASAAATVTAAFPERTAFIEGNFQIYNSTRATRTKTGDSYTHGSTAIKMAYEGGHYVLHTHSTPAELAEQLNNNGAYFYIKTSTADNALENTVSYQAILYDKGGENRLSASGYDNKLPVSTTDNRGFCFTGSDDGYVIIHFDGTHVWYTLESALSYDANTGTGEAPAPRDYYSTSQTAAANSYTKTGYTFSGWNTAPDGSGASYAAGATNVAMNAAEVVLYAQWTANNYTVRFENLGADAGHKGSLDTVVTYNDTINMKSGIVVPSKTHYDFGGYYISTDGGVTLTSTQIINANGAWVKNVSGYTGEKGNIASWVCDGDTTLYAKWTEHEYTITTAVSPVGAGSVSCGSSTTAKYVTPSGDITATPAAGWKFKEWQFSKTDENYDTYCADGYSSTSNPVRVHAVHDGTLTAVFEPRFSLVGSEYGSSNTKGMPGWEDYTNTFIVNSSDPVNLTCSRTLEASTTYKFQIHDCAESKNLGAGTDGQYVLLENTSAVMANQDKDVKFTSTGAGTYIFHITAIDGSYHPTVEILWPHQTNFGRRRVDIDGTAHDDNTGGTLVVKAGESTISTGSWHTYGTNIAYDADNQTGYQLAWYNSSSYSETFSAGGEWNHDLTSNDNCYAQFSELATKVSLENDGHGKVQIGGVDKTETTCGITTSRTITAVPNTGYSFSGWTKPSGDDLNFTADATNPKTFTSKGGGLQSGQRIYANFSAKTYTVTLHDDHGGSGNGSATATYDQTTLAVASDATFSGWTLLGYWNSSAVQVTDANGNLQANVSNYTDASSHWHYDNNVTLYAHWSRSVTLDDNGGSQDGSVTVFYNQTSVSSLSAPTKAYYQVEGYYADAECTHKVMEANGTLVNYTGYVSDGKWIKGDATTLYAKWTETPYTVEATAGTGGTVGAASYTAYVTTTTNISAPPATGYKFDHWSVESGDITFADDSVRYTTITARSDGSIQAHFDYRWSISGTFPGTTAWDCNYFLLRNVGRNDNSKDTSYVDIVLPANTEYSFTVVNRGLERTPGRGWYRHGTTYEYITYATAELWKLYPQASGVNDKSCGLKTAGAGTYRFVWNITDESIKVIFPSSHLITFGINGSGGSWTSVVDGESNAITSGQYVKDGGSITFTANPNTGYHIAGWYSDASCETAYTSGSDGATISGAGNTVLTLAVTKPRTVYVKFAEDTNTFSATSGNNWSTEANWSAGHVPTLNEVVIITAPATVDVAHAVAKRIILDQSDSKTGKLTIQANKGLEVAGTITKTTDGETYSATTSSDLLLESSASGNATLIFNNSNSDQATVQMYSKGWTTGTQGSGTWNWQFVGVPVTDATRINDYYNGYMYEWNTSTRTWDDVTNTDATLSTFKAYSVSYPTTSDNLHTYEIDGTLAATTNQTIDVAAGQTVQAAANSWTAPIRINNITSTNWSPATIFLYNTGYNPEGSAAGKGEVSGDRYAAGKYLPIPVSSAPYLGESYIIAPMQGFLFKNTKSGSDGTITLNYSSAVRTDGSEGIVAGAMHAPQRQMEAEPVVMKIYVSDSLYDDRVVLLAREDFSRGFDNGWDGEKFQVNAVTTAPRLFAINETGGKEEVSAIPELENTVLGFRPGTEETYTIHFDYNGDETLYLRDTRTGSSTLITNESKYIFLSDGTNEDARFIISRVQSTPTGVEETGAGSKAYKLMIEDHIYIIRDGRMYSIDGALVNLERK